MMYSTRCCLCTAKASYTGIWRWFYSIVYNAQIYYWCNSAYISVRNQRCSCCSTLTSIYPIILWVGCHHLQKLTVFRESLWCPQSYCAFPFAMCCLISENMFMLRLWKVVVKSWNLVLVMPLYWKKWAKNTVWWISQHFHRSGFLGIQ